MGEYTYDVVVLGGGIGGYSAAIRASQLGLSVAIVEKDKLGGTCLHRGCIPSKALLRCAEVYATLKESEQYGIRANNVSLQLPDVMKRKTNIVEQLYQGVQFLMKKHNIDVYPGQGRIIGPSIFSPKCGTIAVERADGEIDLLANKQVIIATGSKPRSIPGVTLDGKQVMSSEEMLNIEQLPKSLVIVGGGVIGVEWASMMSDFGVEVTIVEAEARLVQLEDEDVSQEIERIFKKRNIRVLTQAKLIASSVQVADSQVTMQIEHHQSMIDLQADCMLISVGRTANIDNIGLENTDIQIEKGIIKVNASMQTSESHIYAIGDVIGGVQLAHAAAYEGVLAAEHIVNQAKPTYQAHDIPRCVYSRPEMASIGRTEQQAKDLGLTIKVSKVPFRAIGKAWVYGDTDGFVKVIADAHTHNIVGVHMIGPHVTDYIAEVSLAQLLNATPWEIGQSIHPHPTLSEIVQEAMQALEH
jgi:dihydrolipoamide dehydrogenase